jgi:hypothetical protein
MKKERAMRYAISLILVVACASCASKRAAVVPAARAGEGGPVITQLVGREQTIVVRAGVNGPTYSVESKDGELLRPPMTIDELAMSDPELYRAVRSMQAGRLWAGKESE